MRLIDADDVITVFTNRIFEILKTQIPTVTATETQICLETCYKVAKYEIDNIPTAYDIDKVVEELEKLRDKAHECFCIGHDTEDMAEYNAFDTAIDIVKAGVKNEM